MKRELTYNRLVTFGFFRQSLATVHLIVGESIVSLTEVYAAYIYKDLQRQMQKSPPAFFHIVSNLWLR